MGRQAWVLVGLVLAAYWSAVAYHVVSARGVAPAPNGKLADEWGTTGMLTLPWSLLGDIGGDEQPPESLRASYTVAMSAGGFLNGLLFVMLVWLVARSRRPSPDVAGDYDDAPPSPPAD